MLKRPYGDTGEMLSIIGFGGIVVKDAQPDEASRIVSEAIDRGINYFDVAPRYGNAQEKLGPALEPYRNDVFLACKTRERDAAGAERELHDSLKKLRTDHFDLYQMHGMTTDEDVDTVLGPGGALETFQKAREQGLVRFLGFSAHSVEAATRLLEAFEFNSVLFPLNWVNYFEGDFGPQVVELAERKGAARLALKAAAKAKLGEGAERTHEKCWYEPIVDPELAALAVRFTLSQSITAAVPPGDPELWRMVAEIGEDFTPITDEETDILKKEARSNTPIFVHPAA
ncbi:MAG: aldo/keto reductase [Chloroflexi bacterium]|jgi:predicted aldo/keto reductase-like oxidoreductase|nr:aldo/keto reductase [Chloroflexota bacterium]MBT4074263.1 aldo/keto reductase [Chloroflexota bacterium]MBT4515737.1 aldo/keto reductase [Chloroflexota bacterium]MBT5320711.1 aldo/keto reductase [Chloroflexota bacterium]MBT6683023.1 aldo/keto reductase [Chloroflexota bacterium]